MNKLVFASSNAGKIQELKTLLSQFNLDIVSQAELNVTEIPETGLTFVENALLKARNASQQTGMPAIADDSGLVVKALHGAPGIYSARYAGEKSDAAANNAKLLSELKNFSAGEREAYFHCTLVYLEHPDDPTPLICEGHWQGSILTSPVGKQGFGYDPIFYDLDLQCSAAELPLPKKNLVSHRGQALRSLIEKLQSK